MTTMTTSISSDCIITNVIPTNSKVTELSMPISNDQANTNIISSSNISQRMNLISSSRLQLPTLINTNVQDFSDSLMDVDTDPDVASRKRALPASITDKQGNIKAKRSVNAENKNNNSIILKDSLTDPGKKNNKILYTNSDCPPYIIHVYSQSEDLQ